MELNRRTELGDFLPASSKKENALLLIRPLTNEEGLQNLDQLELDQLRPEFASQVITFRRFILNRIKPKIYEQHGFEWTYVCRVS